MVLLGWYFLRGSLSSGWSFIRGSLSAQVVSSWWYFIRGSLSGWSFIRGSLSAQVVLSWWYFLRGSLSSGWSFIRGSLSSQVVLSGLMWYFIRAVSHQGVLSLGVSLSHKCLPLNGNKSAAQMIVSKRAVTNAKCNRLAALVHIRGAGCTALRYALHGLSDWLLVGHSQYPYRGS